MVGKKIIAVAFSDLHINDWAKFNAENKRTLDHFRVLSLIREICLKNDCPAFFCGDLMHKPENISLDLALTMTQQMKELDRDEEWHMYAISGNHDLTKIVKDPQNMPPSWIKVYSEKFLFLHDLDFARSPGRDYVLYGIPYMDHNLGLNDVVQSFAAIDDKGKKKILLLHTDYPGAKDTDGSEVGSSENLNLNLLDKFDLVLIGHIHKPQRLGKKVYMVGAPLQQRRTDKNCDLGYWAIYEDFTLKFHSLGEYFPKFIDVSSEDEIQENGNYYTVISDKVLKSEDKIENTLQRGLSKRKLVRRYLKDQGIEDPKKKKVLLNIIKESEND